VKTSVKGASEMIANLKKIAQRFPDRVGAAMYQEGQVEMTESKKRCPVETGVLRASGRVSEPIHEGKQISVILSYGGAANDYAIPQHERLDYHHKVGQAKFLESVLNESRSSMSARIAARIDLNKEKE
jgi:hypothetical protein